MNAVDNASNTMSADSDIPYDPPDWSQVEEKFAREILDRGEKYLQSLHDIAASIDQRASTLASIFTAAAVTVLAVLGANIKMANEDLRFTMASIAVALVWFAAAWLCIAALAPSKFHVPGIHPWT